MLEGNVAAGLKQLRTEAQNRADQLAALTEIERLGGIETVAKDLEGRAARAKTAADAGEAALNAILAKIKDAEAAVRATQALADSAKADAEKEARASAESIVSDARKQADDIVAKAKSAADEASKQAEAALAKRMDEANGLLEAVTKQRGQLEDEVADLEARATAAEARQREAEAAVEKLRAKLG